MRNIILQSFMLVVFLFFVSCGEANETVYFEAYEPSITEIEAFEETPIREHYANEIYQPVTKIEETTDLQAESEYTHAQPSDTLEKSDDETECESEFSYPPTRPLFDSAPDPFIPPPSEITPFGRQVLEEFIVQFSTLFRDTPIPITGVGFTHRRDLEEGQFSLGRGRIDGVYLGSDIITYDVPDIFFRSERIRRNGALMWNEVTENHGFFDRYGNNIENVLWIWGDHYATHFRVWDFDHDGIPEITVYFGGNQWETTGNGGTAALMFKFIDGEYRNVSRCVLDFNYARPLVTSWSFFYFDHNGRLVRQDFRMGGGYFQWFDYFDISSGYAELSPIAAFDGLSWAEGVTFSKPFDWSEIVWQTLDMEMEWGTLFLNQDILRYTMNISLTPISPINFNE